MVGLDEIAVALGRGGAGAEPFPFLREESGQAAPVQPVDLRPATDRHRGEHRTGDAFSMPLRVCEAERRAPAVPEQVPSVDAEVRAEPFEIGQQMLRRVRREVDARIARVGCAAAAAPLVEQHDAVDVRIEELAHRR